MKTALLFVAFPPAKSDSSDPSVFQTLFHSESSNALVLSNSTKKINPDLSSFPTYIDTLNRHRGTGQLPATWYNPFKTQIKVKSNSIESEMLSTIWNFMSALHLQLLEIDTSDNDQLKQVKPILTDIFACQKNFADISCTVDHPIFTPQLAAFVDAYGQYIADYWQLSIVLANKENLAPKPTQRCILDIKRCMEAARKLEETSRTYFSPVCQSIENYLCAYLQFLLGNNALKEMKFGIGIAHFSEGTKYSQRRSENITFAPQLSTANKFIRNALNSIMKTTIDQNKTSYFDSIPSSPPEAPPPQSSCRIDPNPQLLLSAPSPSPSPSPAAFGTAAPMSPPQIPQVPTYQPPPPQQTYQQPYQQDYQQPYQQPFVPPSQPQNLPNQSQYAAPFSPPQQADTGFPEWDALILLKSKLVPRIQGILSNPRGPNDQRVCGELFNQMNTAAQSDSIIQNTIDQFKAGVGDRDTVQGLIKQASNFYTQVEERLNKLEKTGQ
ncbi:hypothetical protein TRFO_25120 [Tritrichomonas foetus]|uniref:BRO1 domain-containing protein n=1 Tax=Tritrichomonas foetus TaxID=1144522 RepID=A0A1J4K6K4_9EUKA|nr:hypothetical protein TRFO_25120 [Tritrichomonas foetus]|eukprot:OHT06811.1 hypothetical protein TRFO_25120 [Tritrichomonas foetus]